MGPTFVRSRVAKTGVDPSEVAKAYLVVREAFELQGLWRRIEALDNIVPANTQLIAMQEIVKLVERETTWMLTRLGQAINVSTDIPRFKKGFKALKSVIDTALTNEEKQRISDKFTELTDAGLPDDIAHDIALLPALGSVCDIIRVSDESKADIREAAAIYYELGEIFHLDWLRAQSSTLPVNNKWNAEALDGLIDQLYSCQTGLTIHILNRTKKSSDKKSSVAKTSIVRNWIDTHEGQAQSVEMIFSDIRASAKVDIGMLVIIEQRLRALFGG